MRWSGSASPASIRSRAGSIRACTAAGSSRCGCTPAGAARRTRTSASATCWEQGQTGLSVALDLPTQMGLDSDHELAAGEVGKVGVAIDTLADMERVFAGIPLDRVSTSFTINATAPILLAMYQVVGEQQGVEPAELRGTVQNDILKEFLARKTYIYPPAPSLRLVADVIEYASPRAAALQPDLGLRLPPPPGGMRRSSGDRLHARQRRGLRPGGRRSRSRRRSSSPAASRSTSRRCATSSRRSRSIGRHDGSGPGSCATASVRATRARGRCGSSREVTGRR